MSEFVNVTEVEKLPLNKIESLVAIDADKNIKRTSIVIDQEVDEQSVNPISSKGAYKSIDELRKSSERAVDKINIELESFAEAILANQTGVAAINENLENYATKEWVDKEIPSLDGYATEKFVTDKNYATKSDIPSLTGYATESYVSGLIGDINTVLDRINGEVV